MRELLIYIYQKTSELFLFISNHSLESVSVIFSLILCVTFIYYFKNDIDFFINGIHDYILRFLGVTNGILATSIYYSISFLIYSLGIATICVVFYFGIHTMFPKFGNKGDRGSDVQVPVEIKEVKIKKNFNYFSHNYQAEKKLRNFHFKRTDFKINTEDLFSEYYYIWYVEELVRIASVLRSRRLTRETVRYNQRNTMDLLAFINANTNSQMLAIDPNIYGVASQARYEFLKGGTTEERAFRRARVDNALDIYINNIS